MHIVVANIQHIVYREHRTTWSIGQSLVHMSCTPGCDGQISPSVVNKGSKWSIGQHVKYVTYPGDRDHALVNWSISRRQQRQSCTPGCDGQISPSPVVNKESRWSIGQHVKYVTYLQLVLGIQFLLQNP